MKFDALISMLRRLPYFDLATVVQLSGERRSTLGTQLNRWIKAGKLLSLRRGMYAFPERYRQLPINPAELANQLYRPSYVSGLWALGFYGLIPEKVVMYTSVTTRVPRRFENELGVFNYRHVKQDAFFAYQPVEIQEDKVLLAEPEKALLDLWHLTKGAWTLERMAEMRFQYGEVIDAAKLKAYAETFHSPRLQRAAATWCQLACMEEEGTVDL